jgi:hypothetical protein
VRRFLDCPRWKCAAGEKTFHRERRGLATDAAFPHHRAGYVPRQDGNRLALRIAEENRAADDTLLQGARR